VRWLAKAALQRGLGLLPGQGEREGLRLGRIELRDALCLEDGGDPWIEVELGDAHGASDAALHVNRFAGGPRTLIDLLQEGPVALPVERAALDDPPHLWAHRGDDAIQGLLARKAEACQAAQGPLRLWRAGVLHLALDDHADDALHEVRFRAGHGTGIARGGMNLG